MARGLAFGGRAVLLLLLAWTATPHELSGAAIAVTLAETSRVVFDLGIETWLVRAIGLARDRESDLRARQSAFALRMLCATVAAIGVYFIATSIASLNPRLAGAAAVLTVTGLLGGVPVAVLQGRLQLHRLLTSQIPILAVGLVTVFIEARMHVVTDAMLITLGAFESVAVMAMIRVSGLGNWAAGRTNLQDLRALMRECAPVALFNILVGAYLRLDVWFIAALAISSLPTYTVAFRLYQPTILLLSSIAGVAYAAMAKNIGRDSTSKLSVGVWTVLGGAGFMLALALIMRILGGLAIDQWFSRYTAAKRVLLVFAFLLPVVGTNGMLTAIFSAHGHFRMLSKLAAFNLVVFAIALFELVPRYGAVGAAAALLLGEIANMCVQIWLVRDCVIVRTSRA